METRRPGFARDGGNVGARERTRGIMPLRAQLPVVLSRFQEPEPDIAILRGSIDHYFERHPRPSDILAIIEVTDHSLAYDRTTKLRLYAAAGIPRYRIVNIPEGALRAP